MKALSLLLAALTLTGCASVSLLDGLMDRIKDVAKVDAEFAIELNTKATDLGAPYRLECWKAIHEFVVAKDSAIPSEVDPKGLLSAYELAAQTVARVQAVSGPDPLREAVQARCAYLMDEARRFAIRNVSRFAPLPGVGAAGRVLGRE